MDKIQAHKAAEARLQASPVAYSTADVLALAQWLADEPAPASDGNWVHRDRDGDYWFTHGGRVILARTVDVEVGSEQSLNSIRENWGTWYDSTLNKTQEGVHSG